MWKVQTEGYQNKSGMLVGTVSYDLSDAPDGEFICGGLNSKGPKSMAIGRQGNYLHWGFAVSPTYMTDEAKLVFVNAIHYIHKFKGHRAFTTKKPVSVRTQIDSLLYRLSDRGNDVWAAYIEESAVEDRKIKRELSDRKAAGEKLNESDEARLDWDEPTWDRMDALKRLPSSLRDELGNDIDSYVKYFSENRDYMFSDPERRYAPLEVDADAKELGIPNHDLRILDKCVQLLHENPKNGLARRVLERYTERQFESAGQWQEWLAERRDYLFFSEPSGYKFLLDTNRVLAAGKQRWLIEAVVARRKIADQMLVNGISVDQPNDDQPVKYDCRLVALGGEAFEELNAKKEKSDDGKPFRLIVKFKIQDGWHLYASVPKGEPYIQTNLKVIVPAGVSVNAPWKRSVAKPSASSNDLTIWESECVWSIDLNVSDKSALETKVELILNYQACNEERCRRPVSKTIELKFDQ